MPDEDFNVNLELADGYRFLVDFGLDGGEPLLVDEPPPLGEGAGPNAARLLAAAIANCLSASALFCLRKAHIDVRAMKTEVSGSFERNDEGRLRIARIDVHIEPRVAEEDEPRMRRCLELFESYCTVTQSVREGIDVRVDVRPEIDGPPVPAHLLRKA